MTDHKLRDFIRTERRRLVGYVRSIVNETADIDAEDLVHDVLLRLLERADNEGAVENLTAYVYQSMRNRVVDASRRRQLSVSIEDSDASFTDWLRTSVSEGIDSITHERNRLALFNALNKLTDIERDVVIAHEFEGASFKTLAARLKMPVNTLLSHKSRAIKKLRRQLTQTQEVPCHQHF